MFDPTVGRWMTLDPIGFDAGDPNLYRYVGNSPTNGTDPSGLADPMSALFGRGNGKAPPNKDMFTLKLMMDGTAAAQEFVAAQARQIERVADDTLRVIDTVAATKRGRPDQLRFDSEIAIPKGVLTTVAAAADVVATHNEGNSGQAATKGGSFGVGYFAESVFVAPGATAEQLMAKGVWGYANGEPVNIDEPLPAPVETALMRNMPGHNLQKQCRQIAATGDVKSAERGATSAPFIDFIIVTLATEGLARGVPYIPRNIVVHEAGPWNVTARQGVGETCSSTSSALETAGRSYPSLSDYGPVKPLKQPPQVGPSRDDLLQFQFAKDAELGLQTGRALPKPPTPPVESNPAVPIPQSHGELKTNVINAGRPKPIDMVKPEMHHELPWTHREWFAESGRGLDVNRPEFGRWVEFRDHRGSGTGWSVEYDRAWDAFREAKPNATQQDVLAFLERLRATGKYK